MRLVLKVLRYSHYRTQRVNSPCAQWHHILSKIGWAYVFWIPINTLRPRQNGRHFADNIFKCIFLNQNTSISVNISLKLVPEGRINNIPALVQIMAWCWQGDKPLSEPMMISLLTYIYASPGLNELTHYGLVMPYGIIYLGQLCFRWWLAACWHQSWSKPTFVNKISSKTS